MVMIGVCLIFAMVICANSLPYPEYNAVVDMEPFSSSKRYAVADDMMLRFGKRDQLHKKQRRYGDSDEFMMRFG